MKTLIFKTSIESTMTLDRLIGNLKCLNFVMPRPYARLNKDHPDFEENDLKAKTHLGQDRDVKTNPTNSTLDYSQNDGVQS